MLFTCASRSETGMSTWLSTVFIPGDFFISYYFTGWLLILVLVRGPVVIKPNEVPDFWGLVKKQEIVRKQPIE